MSNKLLSFVFKTDAFRVCPANQPFWLTSGLISPYFVNTHFLYGDETSAVDLLNYITESLATLEKTELPATIFEKTYCQYENNIVYQTTINALKTLITQNIDMEQIDYISGGERRDWYFSIIIANLLQKPHITLFKDQSSVLSTYDFKTCTKAPNLTGKKVLHIADLFTKASSFINYWNPAICKLGAEIVYTVAVVDRLEGAETTLTELNIKALSLIKLDNSLFENALTLNIIDNNQFEMLIEFKKAPYTYMRDFLITHPEFLENALKADKKTIQRATTCIDNDLYNLKNN